MNEIYDSQPVLDKLRADHLETYANLLTDTRLYGGIITSSVLAIKGPNWPLAVTISGLEYTDKKDGDLAREAASLRRSVTTLEGSERDHVTDKIFYYSHMGAMVIRDALDGNLDSALFVSANVALVGIRDLKMAQTRKKYAGIKSTSATLPNKLKTLEQDVTIVLGSSPISKSETGHLARNTAIAVGTAMAWISYLKFKRDLESS